MLKTKPKLLFIISKDFGELYNALLFAEPLLKNHEILFLLPEKLYNLNYADFPCLVKKYQTFIDLKNELSDFLPDICFLFSGYLLTVNNLISAKELTLFLKLIKRLEINLITSDPWLNIWPNLNTTEYPSLNFNDPAQVRVCRMFENLSVKLKDIYHLYMVPLNKKPKKSLYYYNKNIRLSFYQRFMAKISFRRDFPELAEIPFWLFVISGEDAQFLADKIYLIVERLKDALAIGRRSVFIGPEKIIVEIKKILDSSEVLFFAEVSLSKFKKIFLQAEFVFYCNVFSATILGRIINSKPIFCFDLGHMARYFPPFCELGQKIYYGKTRLSLLDMKDSVSMEKLNKFKKIQKDRYRYFHNQRTIQPDAINVLNALL